MATTQVTSRLLAAITGTGRPTARTTEDRIADVANIRDFGAKGDGSDDTAAIALALLSGSSSIFVPSGTFWFSSLTIPSNVRIFGTGTLKRLATTGIASGVSYMMQATGTDWSIEGITIDGNRTNQAGTAGFKVRGILVRGALNWSIARSTWKNVHDTVIEVTTATQNNPTGPDTPGALPADTIYRWSIYKNFILDCGRNVDDGFGYSNSMAIQIGSATQDGQVEGNVIYNCLAGILAAAYNKRLRIALNTCYVDFATYSYRSSAIAVEQMSDQCAVIGNVVEGFREAYNVESVLRTTIIGNTSTNCLRGVNCFASSIGGVAINMRKVVISDNVISGSTNEAIKVSKSSGNGAYDITVSDNVIDGGSFGINASGLTRGKISDNEITGCATGIQLDTMTDSLAEGNLISGNTAEGIYVNACTRTTIRGGASTGNNYGVYVAAGQTSLVIEGVTMLNNTAKDYRVDTPNTNNVRAFNLTYVTSTNPQKTISADGASLQWTGDTILLAAGTYTNFTGLQPDRCYRFIALGAVTLTHNAAVTNKIWNATHANVVLAANDTHQYTSDGTYVYDC